MPLLSPWILCCYVRCWLQDVFNYTMKISPWKETPIGNKLFDGFEINSQTNRKSHQKNFRGVWKFMLILWGNLDVTCFAVDMWDINIPLAPFSFPKRPWREEVEVGVGRHLGAISPVCFWETILQRLLVWNRVPFGVLPVWDLDGWTILLLQVELIAIWGIACYQVIVLPANHRIYVHVWICIYI